MRAWLWKALCEVVLHHAYSNLYLKEHLQELPQKDRGLAARIFYGTLQNYAYCQAMWKPYATGRVSGKLGVLLTFSCYQLHFLDKVPAYAVIHEAVQLAKKQDKRQGAFVNAILHKVQEHPLELPDDPLKRLALQTSLPEWLVSMWKAQYGMETASQLAWSSVHILPVYVRINPERLSGQELEEKIQAGILKPDPSGLYEYVPGTLAWEPMLAEGKISAMDPGSYAIACYGNPRPGMQVLDMCAAPGTKTMAMAEAMENQGSITALDLHPHRAELIARDAKRLGIEIVQARAQDSTRLKENPVYDLVLCDVPCSGYGVLARKPDMKLHLDGRQMDTLIPLQASLLESGAAHVRPGGTLVYSTCTLNKKENEKQVEAFLKNNPAFVLEDQQTLLANSRQDGFYMARLKRIDSHTQEEQEQEQEEGL